MLFFKGYGLLFLFAAEYAGNLAGATREYCDAYSVGTRR